MSSAAPVLAEGLSDIQKSIAELLINEPVHADTIAQKLGIDAAELMTELTELEIMGVINSLPGKMFEIC
jgi:DNA processing protein